MHLSLAKLQNALVSYVYRSALSESFPSELASLTTLGNNSHGLTIYAHNNRASLTALLQDVYPVCQALIGTEYFQHLANRYRQAYPSLLPDLHQFGADFSELLLSEAALQQLPYVYEMAKLEWAWHRSYHAADEAPFDFKALAQCTAEEQSSLRLHLAQHVHLLATKFPVLAIWQVHQDSSIHQKNLTIPSGNYYTLVYRPPDGKPIVMELTAAEAAFLQACQNNAYLSVCLAESGFPATEVSAWIERGIINCFSITPRKPGAF